jgi:hypothetical protein
MAKSASLGLAARAYVAMEEQSSVKTLTAADTVPDTLAYIVYLDYRHVTVWHLHVAECVHSNTYFKTYFVVKENVTGRNTMFIDNGIATDINWFGNSNNP